ncbi:MAG: winged helix-turn-helix transcriptional regulator [Pseudomonadota bacterium]
MPLPKSPMGCPMDAILRLLMGRWTSYILYMLRANGPTRFGELKRRVQGVSAKVLTERLRLLEQAEVIQRHYQPTIPPQVTYSLAPRGLELSGVIDALNAIARKWQADDEAVKPKAA